MRTLMIILTTIFGLSQIGFGQNLEHECILQDSLNIKVEKFNNFGNGLDSVIKEFVAHLDFIKDNHDSWEEINPGHWDIKEFHRRSGNKLEIVILIVDGVNFVNDMSYQVQVYDGDKLTNSIVFYHTPFGPIY